jgi:hypothetical protein
VPDDAAVVCTVQKNVVTTTARKKPRQLGGAAFVRTTNLNLTEPLRSLCPGFNLAEGLVVIALRSQLVPIFGATAF